ncbi:BolA/IbaG family iron-sulfur metabolism protein [Marinibactrum halimedae]|nr:BolA/IbaG family iron-sulfur metabolism protein [Marinibactrum halimedae]MCD9457531.1 BolA/IbaG family iron-sulfur metabolism protein [Marinibactrum halimedae]
MQPEEIKQLLEDNIEDSQVEVDVSGSHVNLVIVSPVFEGLMPVKKQQLVYKVLQAHISDGTIHAVNMKTLTPSQWKADQS